MDLGHFDASQSPPKSKVSSHRRADGLLFSVVAVGLLDKMKAKYRDDLVRIKNVLYQVQLDEESLAL